MSDTRYPKRSVPGEYDELADTPSSSSDLPADDPLVELARLIDEDPFADFNSRRREPSVSPETGRQAYESHPVEPESPIEAESDVPVEAYDARYAQHVEPELPPSDDLADATEYDRESTERLYADLAAASQRVEPRFGGDYRQHETYDEPVQQHQAWPADDYEQPSQPPQSAQPPLPQGHAIHRAPADEPEAYRAAPDYADHEPYAAAPELRGADYTDDVYAESEPVYDESGHIPPYDGEVPVEPEGRRKGTLIVAGLLGLIVLGGASALVYRGIFGESTSGPPPVIRADNAPSKLEPETSGAEEAPQQGKLVYDRVGGNAANDEARLVSREEPVADVGGRQVRVIDPNQGQTQAQGAGLRGTAPTGDSPADGAAGEELPKRVRTVVVKPDGTIVGEIEAPKPAEPLQPAPLQPAPLPGTPQPSEPEQTAAAETQQPATTGVPIPEPRPADLASSQPAAGQAAPAPAPSAARNQPGTSFVPPAAPAPAQPQSGQPLQLNPNVVATLPTGQQNTAPAPAPTQTTTTAAAPTQPAEAQTTTFPPGSYVVQVAASRSEQDARGTAASISQRYSGQLSGYSPAVERADLGDRGIYYRVGVGPMRSQGDANALCSKLKSAGLDCFVRRN
ncbi:SPOR domain-containing protein [Microbaculum marinisediminis]|uniref:SPOR domain-containing protein n=1 Tax=Microbaculum marinisediminis TaxID=2931392 RepID=A0AAW5R5R7_9HYPH|nr:SPOR domain-containing protein [Microbaculum sp. A6E488]MCT8974026.1 SPOR domain-containing protein [Microbaculum sp. A6E488]